MSYTCAHRRLFLAGMCISRGFDSNAYTLFFIAGVTMYHFVAESEDARASIWTLAEMMQCLAMLLLAAQVLCTGSVASISDWAIALKAVALVCRLALTLLYNGYQPVGMTGDWFFQSIDLCALAVATWLLYQIFVQKRAASGLSASGHDR